MPSEDGDSCLLDTHSTGVVVKATDENCVQISELLQSKTDINGNSPIEESSSDCFEKSQEGNGILEDNRSDLSKYHTQRDIEPKRRSSERERRSERRGRYRGDSPREGRSSKHRSRSRRSPERYSSSDQRTDEGRYRSRERDSNDVPSRREKNSRGYSRRSHRSRSREEDGEEREKSREKSEYHSKSSSTTTATTTTTTGRSKRVSKWDSLPETLPDNEYSHLQIKPYEGGFSSAPPPPPVPPPSAAASTEDGQGTETTGSTTVTTPPTALSSTIRGSGDTPIVVYPPAVALQSKLLTAAEIEADKKQRRLYIGNLPPGSTQIDVISFFNGALLAVTVGAGSNYGLNENEVPVQKCEVFNLDSRFCFLEFKTLQLTWLCLKLDGIAFNGYSLRVGRPHDYIPPPGGDPAFAATIPGFESTVKEAKPATAPPRSEGTDQKIYIQNIPYEMSDEQVKDMLEQFGSLRVLNLIKDLNTGKNKGYGFFEYEDPAHTEVAIQALNGFFCGGNVLVVQRASFNGPPTGEKKRDVLVTSLSSSMTHRILSHALVGLQIEATRKTGEKPSKVVQLLNTVFQEDLLDDAEYNEIIEDIKGEASKYGPLEQICIPRPLPDLSFQEGVGKVFLLFSDETAARKARMMMNGRKFDNARVVCAAFYPEDRFLEGKYTLN